MKCENRSSGIQTRQEFRTQVERSRSRLAGSKREIEGEWGNGMEQVGINGHGGTEAVIDKERGGMSEDGRSGNRPESDRKVGSGGMGWV